MRIFGLLPRGLRKIFAEASHHACILPFPQAEKYGKAHPVVRHPGQVVPRGGERKRKRSAVKKMFGLVPRGLGRIFGKASRNACILPATQVSFSGKFSSQTMLSFRRLAHGDWRTTPGTLLPRRELPLQTHAM